MITLPINIDSFGSKTQKLWPKNRSACKVRCKIVQVFLAISLLKCCEHTSCEHTPCEPRVSTKKTLNF